MKYQIPERCIQIRSNCVIEYQIYPSPPSQKNMQRGKKSSAKFSEGSKKRMKRIADILSYSFTGQQKKFSFVTLTLSSQQKKEVDYYKLLRSLLEKTKYHFPNTKYLWKGEHQKNNNVHFHILFTEEIEWRFIRAIWNKLQKMHVDDYQTKQKLKYKKGYYYDTEMTDSSGQILNEEQQEKIYKRGYKANFRNPNSTDVKIVDSSIESLNSYLYKYITKTEETEIDEIYKLKRYWGCSDELRLLRFPILFEGDLSIEEYLSITNSMIKTVEENGIIRCKIYERTLTPSIKIAEEEVKKRNIEIVKTENKPKTDSALRIVENYKKLFE